MKKIISLPLLLVLCLLTGCAGMERPLTDAALGAGGGVLASELSDGNPAVTAIGTVSGIAVGEGIHAMKTRSERKSFSDGYRRGRADGIKAIYWNLVDQQRDAGASK